MFNIPENTILITKNGLNVELIVSTNTGEELKKNLNWIYHSIKAYILIDNEKKEIGYLNIAYIDEKRKKTKFDNLLQYVINIKNDYTYKNKTKAFSLNEITDDEVNEILKLDIPELTMKRKRKILKQTIENQYLESYNNFLNYHYNKPEPDFIHVDEEYRRNGVGNALYSKAIEFCLINNLNFFQSTTQTEEAEKSWDHLRKTLNNVDCEIHEYKIKKEIKLKKRYFINNLNLTKENKIILTNKNSKKQK